MYGSVDFSSITITCPTCKGVGRIPREYESQLVTLIPASDARLKPSKTVYYVICTIVTCGILAGILGYLLMPRDLVLSSRLKRYMPDSVSIDLPSLSVNISVTVQYELQNDNYYPITVQSLKVLVVINQVQIGLAINTTKVSVPMRSVGIQYCTVNITFNDNYEILDYCVDDMGLLILPFKASVQSLTLGHSAEYSAANYPYIDCKT